MTKKQFDDLFSPTALTLPAHADIENNMLSFERSRELERAETKVMEEAHKQLLVIEQQRRKTAEANRAISHLRYNGMQVFSETAESIWAIKSAPGRDPELQRYIDQFGDRSIRDSAMDIYTTTGIGVSRITDEVARSLYFATEQERRSWLVRKLLGEK